MKQKIMKRQKKVLAGIMTLIMLLSFNSLFSGTNNETGKEKNDFETNYQKFLENQKEPLTSAYEESFLLEGQIWQRIYGEKEYFLAPTMTLDERKQYSEKITARDDKSRSVIKSKYQFAKVKITPLSISLLSEMKINVPSFIKGTVNVYLPELFQDELRKNKVEIIILERYGKDIEKYTGETDNDKSNLTIWSKDFENSDWDDNLGVCDYNSSSGFDSWGRVSCDHCSESSHSIWCAGDGSETDCSNYDNDMQAEIMIINGINVSDYNNVRFKYNYKYFQDSGETFKRWESSNGLSWTEKISLVQTDWVFIGIDVIGFTNYYWLFQFKSDGSNHDAYGAYLDDMYITGDAPDPDLVSNITNLTVSGTQVSINASVTNNGAGNAGSSRLAYYLSTNTSISTGDYRIGDDYVSSLSSGSSSNESITVDVTTITPTIPPGTYYIGCIADYTDGVDESNENNNTDYETSPKVTITTIPQGQVDVVARVVWDNTVGKNEIVNGGVVTQAKNYINDQFSWINFTLDFTSGTTAEWTTPSGSPTWVDMINDLMDDFSHTSEQHTIIGLSKKPYEGTGNAGVESQDYAFIDFYPNTQGYNTDEMTIVSIIMHEWGHSLGVKVHCFDTENCVMNTQGVHNRNHAFCSSCKHKIAIHLAGEDFDDNTHNWTLTGLWHVTSYRENSANNSLAYNQESSHDYNTGAANSGTATFDVTLPSSPVLEFDHYRVVESYPSPYDVARVEISTDGGNTWGTLQQWDSRNPTNPWEHVSISLNGYTGDVKIRFYFNTIDNLYNNYEGWYIDDVVVKSNSAKSGQAKLVEATQGDPRSDVVFSYPNPFTGSTTINYVLNEQKNVSLKVYNITGQLVATLVNKQKPAGQHTIQWDANDTNGNKMPNGTYFIRMQTEDNTQTTKLVLMR